MPYYISGVTADHTSLIARTPEEFKQKNGIDVLTRHSVESIDASGKRLLVRDLADGRESWHEYTTLLIATGAKAVIPRIEGVELPGVFVLRNLAHSVAIKEFIRSRKPRRAVIVGAGPIGLEMCESLRTLGMEVTLVDMAGQVMPVIDADMARHIQVGLEEEGVNCMLGQGIEGIDGKESVAAITTTSGEIAADFVLLGIGVNPVTDIAVEAGVEVGAKGAIRVNGRLETGVPCVYAAGDCATTTHALTGEEVWIPLGSTARKQGRLAGDNMSGAGLEFHGVQGTSVVKCLDLTIGRTGLDEAQAKEAGFDPLVVTMEAPALHDYYPGGGGMNLKLFAQKGSGRLLGAQIVGEKRSIAEKRLDILAVAIGAGMTADDLQYLDLAYAPPYSTAVDVPIIAGNLMASKIEGKICGCSPEGLE